MSAWIFIEGAESKDAKINCRKGFKTLIEKLGFKGKLPRLFACGGRNAVYDDFKTAHSRANKGDYIAMLVDSEDPVHDIEQTWKHLKTRDGWQQPSGALDEQVLLMATCMETWIIADQDALKKYYGNKLLASALPPTDHLEVRDRKEIFDHLKRATKNCSNPYGKGEKSFIVLEQLNSKVIEAVLPSFARIVRVLKARLKIEEH